MAEFTITTEHNSKLRRGDHVGIWDGSRRERRAVVVRLESEAQLTLRTWRWTDWLVVGWRKLRRTRLARVREWK